MVVKLLQKIHAHLADGTGGNDSSYMSLLFLLLRMLPDPLFKWLFFSSSLFRNQHTLDRCLAVHVHSINFWHKLFVSGAKDAHFYAKNVQNSVTLCSVSSRRVFVSALHKTHGTIMLNRGKEKPDSSVLIQHNLP